MTAGSSTGRGTVLVVGASGKLGRATLPLLVEAGWNVRAMSRNPGSLADIAKETIVPVGGDLLDPESLRTACEGADAVVAGAHAALGNHGRYRPATVDRKGNFALVETARATGVGRFVFVSGAGAALDHPVDFFRCKAEAEGFVRDGGVPFVILKPGAFMETWAELAGKPILDKGTALLFGDTAKKINYVSVRDVARFVEIALRDDSLLGTTLPIGGPENLSAEEVVTIFERAAGIEARRVRLPRPLVAAVQTISRPLLPAVHRVLQLASLPPAEHDCFDPHPLIARYPGTLTCLADIARERATSSRRQSNASSR